MVDGILLYQAIKKNLHTFMSINSVFFFFLYNFFMSKKNFIMREKGHNPWKYTRDTPKSQE